MAVQLVSSLLWKESESPTALSLENPLGSLAPPAPANLVSEIFWKGIGFPNVQTP